MEIALPILKMAGAALAVVLAVLLAGKSPRALMPIALAVGFVAGYAVLYTFPEMKGEQAWYLDSAWKMSVIAIAVGGVLLALARIVPWWLGLVVAVLMVLAVTGLVVRTTWEGWGYYAGLMAAALVAYIVAMMPIGRDEYLWPVGPLVMWACATVSAILVMAWVDMGLGRMLVTVAVLAGLSLVIGFLRPMRAIVTGAGLMLAMMLAVLLTLAAYYNEGLPRVVFVLAGFAPVGAGIAWLPGMRKRPWLCALAAVGVAALLLVPAVIVAAKNAPALE